MKKILFALQSLHSGGSITSLLNLLQLLKDDGIETDLFLMEHNGVFLDRAYACTNLLPEEKGIASIVCKKENLKKYGVYGYLNRMWYVVYHRLFGIHKANAHFYKKSAKKLSGKYDVVIAYQETMPTEYLYHVEADRHIAWCHMDLYAFNKGKTKEWLQKLYSRFDEIITVSDYVRDTMIEGLGVDPAHITKIYNTIPPKPIIEASKQEISLEKKQFTFVSMGRFVKRKNFDRAVYAANILRNENVDFIWYILGDGQEFENIKQMIKENRLESHVILLGTISNPFPYVKQADAFVLTSESEAQPMVLNEALTLGVPVISTKFASALEVVDHGVNGLVVENSETGVLDGVRAFVSDSLLRETIKKGAADFVYDNKTIISQIMNLL